MTFLHLLVPAFMLCPYIYGSINPSFSPRLEFTSPFHLHFLRNYILLVLDLDLYVKFLLCFLFQIRPSHRSHIVFNLLIYFVTMAMLFLHLFFLFKDFYWIFFSYDIFWSYSCPLPTPPRSFLSPTSCSFSLILCLPPTV